MQRIRFAGRQLRKSPGFAIAAIVTLALGIGATTAIFSLVNAVVLRPLPFKEPDRLVWLQPLDRNVAGDHSLSYPDFFDWRAQNRSFTAIACYRGNSYTLSGVGDAQQLPAEVVSADFFRLLEVHPILGRDLTLDDEKPAARTVMLSHQLWQSTFGGARDIAGRSITLDGQSYTVAGVMPPSFSFPIQNPPPALWTTLADDATGDSPLTSQRGAGMLDVIGRLKPGVSIAQAKAELDVVASRLAAQYPESNSTRLSVLVQPEIEHLVGDTRPALRILFGAVALVLLISCANVAGLLLARASRRRSEIAVQAALGASTGDIIRQTLTESVLLSVIAGALGVALASAMVKWLPRFVPQDLPRLDRISVDGTVLAFATIASILTGVLFGVLPAWRMSRFDPLLALREGSRGVTNARGQSRLQGWVVVAEIALGLILLIGSGLLIRSFVRIMHVDPGFDPHNVLTARLNVPESRYSRERRIEFYHRLMPRIAALPGVQSVAAAYPVPLTGGNIRLAFAIEGRQVAKGEEPSEQMSVVTPDFFRTMRIPVLAGRAFTASDDTKGKPAVIINQAFARKYFPGEDPLGKRIRPGLGDGAVNLPLREIVGVAGDAKRQGLTTAAEPQYYLPWEQAVITAPMLCIRTFGDAANLVASLRTQVSDLDRQVPVYRATTLEDSIFKAAAQPRFQTLLLTSFAAIALLLSSIGLYALLSYMVVQRAAEIGVRMALGAQRGNVVRLILRRGMLLAGVGVAIGLGAAALLTEYMRTMLYNVEPLDSSTFAGVTAVLLLVSLLASTVPAYRAARLDPMRTLRDQ